MWTDWQGTTLTDAKANLAALRGAIISGTPTTLVVSGVRTDFTPGKSSSDPRRLIQELQDYVYKVEVEGWDITAPINPASRRLGVTTPEFL